MYTVFAKLLFVVVNIQQSTREIFYGFMQYGICGVTTFVAFVSTSSESESE
jgi:hypothetical protein